MLYEAWLIIHDLEVAMVAIVLAWAITMVVLYWKHCMKRPVCTPPEDYKKMVVYWSGGYLVSLIVVIVLSLIVHTTSLWV